VVGRRFHPPRNGHLSIIAVGRIVIAPRIPSGQTTADSFPQRLISPTRLFEKPLASGGGHFLGRQEYFVLTHRLTHWT
jgi:hypothetical protein